MKKYDDIFLSFLSFTRSDLSEIRGKAEKKLEGRKSLLFTLRNNIIYYPLGINELRFWFLFLNISWSRWHLLMYFKIFVLFLFNVCPHLPNLSYRCVSFTTKLYFRIQSIWIITTTSNVLKYNLCLNASTLVKGQITSLLEEENLGFFFVK